MNFTSQFGTTFSFVPKPAPVYPFFQTVEVEAEDSFTVGVAGQLKTIPSGGQLTIIVKPPKPTLGQIAYERRASAGRTMLTKSPSVVGPTFVDAVYPPWRRLSHEERTAWEATAAAVEKAIDERHDLDD